ncbi:hypothetical protein SK128_022146 [Halocaridina rubra]|uniref:SOCS box domain-containing protein n=1 Tax=Halocaridina rubra TaxID=373956 RepID=A0AAN9A9V9_HALRR
MAILSIKKSYCVKIFQGFNREKIFHGKINNLFLIDRNGVYLAIAYLVRKLESQFKEESNHHQEDPEEAPLALPGEVRGNADQGLDPEGGEEGSCSGYNKCDLLTLAGHTPTALCLRYLLRAVPRVPIKFLRDQLGGCSRDCGRDIAYLLPPTSCLQPPSLTHLSRAASRQYLRLYDLLPHVIDDLDVPQTLKDYLNLTRE